MVVGLRHAGHALQQRRGGKETAVRKAMQEMLDRDDFSFRCARYQQRREAAHAAQTSLNFAGKSDSFLCCICDLLPGSAVETGVGVETTTATRLFRAG
jgi:hypothetical protein